ncbi:hypothetical protein [Chitinophaga sp.]|uniref:hypothetical protein n=1 Tax=Chitinophaga sp. TaxID=1869181 RepID=UPI0031D6C351
MTNENVPYKINSISELHRMLRLPNPKHSLISMVENSQMIAGHALQGKPFLMGFYAISYKASIDGKWGMGKDIMILMKAV